VDGPFPNIRSEVVDKDFLPVLHTPRGFGLYPLDMPNVFGAITPILPNGPITLLGR
jgi:hypothetical protein